MLKQLEIARLKNLEIKGKAVQNDQLSLYDGCLKWNADNVIQAYAFRGFELQAKNKKKKNENSKNENSNDEPTDIISIPYYACPYLQLFEIPSDVAVRDNVTTMHVWVNIDKVGEWAIFESDRFDVVGPHNMICTARLTNAGAQMRIGPVPDYYCIPYMKTSLTGDKIEKLNEYEFMTRQEYLDRFASTENGKAILQKKQEMTIPHFLTDAGNQPPSYVPAHPKHSFEFGVKASPYSNMVMPFFVSKVKNLKETEGIRTSSLHGIKTLGSMGTNGKGKKLIEAYTDKNSPIRSWFLTSGLFKADDALEIDTISELSALFKLMEKKVATFDGTLEQMRYQMDDIAQKMDDNVYNASCIKLRDDLVKLIAQITDVSVRQQASLLQHDIDVKFLHQIEDIQAKMRKSMHMFMSFKKLYLNNQSIKSYAMELLRKKSESYLEKQKQKLQKQKQQQMIEKEKKEKKARKKLTGMSSQKLKMEIENNESEDSSGENSDSSGDKDREDSSGDNDNAVKPPNKKRRLDAAGNAKLIRSEENDNSNIQENTNENRQNENFNVERKNSENHELNMGQVAETSPHIHIERKDNGPNEQELEQILDDYVNEYISGTFSFDDLVLNGTIPDDMIWNEVKHITLTQRQQLTYPQYSDLIVGNCWNWVEQRLKNKNENAKAYERIPGGEMAVIAKPYPSFITEYEPEPEQKFNYKIDPTDGTITLNGKVISRGFDKDITDYESEDTSDEEKLRFWKLVYPNEEERKARKEKVKGKGRKAKLAKLQNKKIQKKKMKELEKKKEKQQRKEKQQQKQKVKKRLISSLELHSARDRYGRAGSSSDDDMSDDESDSSGGDSNSGGSNESINISDDDARSGGSNENINISDDADLESINSDSSNGSKHLSKNYKKLGKKQKKVNLVVTKLKQKIRLKLWECSDFFFGSKSAEDAHIGSFGTFQVLRRLSNGPKPSHYENPPKYYSHSQQKLFHNYTTIKRAMCRDNSKTEAIFTKPRTELCIPDVTAPQVFLFDQLRDNIFGGLRIYSSVAFEHGRTAFGYYMDTKLNPVMKNFEELQRRYMAICLAHENYSCTYNKIANLYDKAVFSHHFGINIQAKEQLMDEKNKDTQLQFCSLPNIAQIKYGFKESDIPKVLETYNNESSVSIDLVNDLQQKNKRAANKDKKGQKIKTPKKKSKKGNKSPKKSPKKGKNKSKEQDDNDRENSPSKSGIVMLSFFFFFDLKIEFFYFCNLYMYTKIVQMIKNHYFGLERIIKMVDYPSINQNYCYLYPHVHTILCIKMMQY